MAKIAIYSSTSRSIPGWAAATEMLLQAGHEVMDPGAQGFRSESMNYLWQADAWFVGLNPITKDMISASPNLKVIAKPGRGVDNIDIDAATESGVIVCNTPGSNANAVADHVMSLVLAVARNIVKLDKLTRDGQGWATGPHIGKELTGKTLGIAGCGSIGRAVIKRAVLGFNMRVLCYDVYHDDSLVEEYGVQYASLDSVLSESDIISVHLPLTDQTSGIIGERQFSLMKRDAILINTSRGGVVDEKALVDALRSNTIAGAGIDVFEQEPCLHSDLFNIEQVVLTPHIAGHSPEASKDSWIMSAENLISSLSGNPIRVFNQEVLSADSLKLRHWKEQ